MRAALTAGLVAGYGIAMPVGAIGAYLVALAARTRLRVGAAAALGVATADGVYATVAVTAGGAVAPLLRPAAGPLRWAAAVVLGALAVRGTVAALRQYRASADVGGGSAADRPDAASPVRAWAGLLGLTILNPLTVLYFAALVLGGGGRAAAGTWPDRAVFVAAAFAASASWQLLLACGGSLLGRLLTGRRGRLATALCAAALMAALAVRAALE
ncbi:lysine transporter LysE [Mangrovactinospora gilvigrisea]|uniref:Lysine transporter LysE n=1 Tax=Mangrovactinospora gilvigrisea TaxID=1428644 RepID=A0A1J7BX51_9ACTN|nr:LysE family transporter [Mangrovactinospora gilvigrisea]OIV38057.1 lysine transporter LysE [Mangrovactinospora gilvigrisea]